MVIVFTGINVYATSMAQRKG